MPSPPFFARADNGLSCLLDEMMSPLVLTTTDMDVHRVPHRRFMLGGGVDAPLYTFARILHIQPQLRYSRPVQSYPGRLPARFRRGKGEEVAHDLLLSQDELHPLGMAVPAREVT
jgi:hypothetical protein